MAATLPELPLQQPLGQSRDPAQAGLGEGCADGAAGARAPQDKVVSPNWGAQNRVTGTATSEATAGTFQDKQGPQEVGAAQENRAAHAWETDCAVEV